VGSVRLQNNLPIGAGQTAAENIRSRFSTVAEVTQNLRETMGYVPQTTPQFACPMLTAEMMTTVDWNSYSVNYVTFKVWWDFYREKLAEVTNMVLQHKNMLTMIEVRTKKAVREIAEATGEKLTVERLKDRVLENAEYQDVMLELQRWQHAKELVEAKFESLDKSMFMISRQVEIRRVDIEQHRVANNMPTRGVTPRGL
jgi:hypothetical protein